MKATVDFKGDSGSIAIKSNNGLSASIKINANGSATLSGGIKPASVSYDPDTGTYKERINIPVGNGAATFSFGNNKTINPDGSITYDSLSIGVTGKLPGGGGVLGDLSVGAGIDEDGNTAFKFSGKLSVSLPGNQISYSASFEDVYWDPADLFDPEENGQLSTGALGKAFSALKNRGAQIDAQVDAAVNGIDPNSNNLFLDAKVFVPRSDPLTLDLDGDGIETVSANTGITFDFDGDGLKTGTGWVKGDDGFLVIDRNGNGTIDNGSELFGVDTIKSNGQKASDGFDALRDLDGNGDGMFDAQDAQFGNVRVWQDLNQDGVAQANELKTLAEHHITAVNLNSTASNQNSNGNIISATGSFIRDDGSEGAVNDNQSLAANLDLANNPFYREYLDALPISDAVAALPDMQGSGAVRDLREAATQNAELAQQLASYANAGTRAQQMAQLDSLLSAWAGSSGYRTLFERIDDMELGSGMFLSDIEFIYSWEKPAGIAGSSSGGGGGTTTTGISIEDGIGGFAPDPTPEQLKKKALLEKVAILEVFNGQNFFNFSSEQKEDSLGNTSHEIKFVAGTSTRTKRPSSGNSGIGLPEIIFITEEDLVINAGQEALLNQAYEALRDSVYAGLVLQTRLKPYIEAVDIALTEDSVTLNYSGLIQRIADVGAIDAVQAIIDIYDLRLSLPQGLDHSRLGTMTDGLLAQLSAEQKQSLTAQLGGQILRGSALGETLRGSTGNDFLLGEDGNDYLYGENGNDTLISGSGNDALNGGSGNDLLLGGEGNDNLSGGAGNDILDGGAGNDALNGGAGSDTYRFSRGWGQDTINNYDTGANKTDAIVFAEDISPDDILVSRSSSSLVLSLAGSTDKITVNNYFSNDGTSTYKLEEIRFANGTSWSIDQVKVMAMQGTDGNDYLWGYASNDTLSGGLGNDTLYGQDGDDVLNGGAGDDRLNGENGNDTLNGDAGNDYLSGDNGDDLLFGGEGNDNLNGDAGNDILDGGAGNDALNGGAGSDTYRFSRGGGQDTINNYDISADSVDTLRFEEGISVEQLWFRRNGSNLEVSVIGTTDKATISSWYSNSNYRLDQFQTADGRTLLDGQVQNLVDSMAAFGVPAGGESNLTPDQRAQLDMVIAANWQ